MWPYLTLFPALFVLGAGFYAQKERAGFEQFAFAVVTYFSIQSVLYVFVPVAGPRFACASSFESDPQGVFLGTEIWRLYLHAPYLRDGFPSGHVGTSLLGVAFAYRLGRRWFLVALPLAIGIIGAATLLRFHYLVDEIAALPMFAMILLASRLSIAQGVWPWAFTASRFEQQATAGTPSTR